MKKCLIMFMPILFILAPLFLSAATNPCWSVAISSSPSPAYAGDTMTFSARLWVKFEAVTNLRVIGVVDGVRIYDNTFASLAAGATRNISFTWPATLGDHTAYFQIDPDDTVAEVGTDNLTEMAFSIGARPPAIPLNIYFSSNSIAPDPLYSGDESLIHYAIFLPDPITTPVTVTVAFRVNGTQIATRTHTLGARGGADDQFIWNVVCGANLEVILDPLNAIVETNETDNSWTYSVVCAERPRPNLIIPRWTTSWTPEFIHTGDRVTINYSVTNAGDGNSGAFKVGLKVGDRIVERTSHPALTAHDSATGSISWTADCSGPWALVADCDNENIETDETDNNLQNDRFGCAVPNFVALEFYRSRFSTESDIPADTSFVYFFRLRLDDDTLVSNVRVKIGIVGGAVLHDETFPSLERTVSSVEKNIALPAGSYTLYAMVDSENTIAERNETDNRMELFVRAVGEGSTPHAVVVPVTKNNYKITIENKKALQKGTINHSTDNWVLGELSNTGNTSILTANVPVRLMEENTVTHATRTIWEETISLAPNAKHKIKWRWNPATAGKYKLTLGIDALGTDAIPKDNKDEVNVTVK
jgi:hypothetical protein